jgi:uncharacterized OB-fold protein
MTTTSQDVTMLPPPILTGDSAAYWAAVGEGRLVVQRCADCGRFQHPPRPMCPECHSLEQRVVDVSGLGVVYSYSLLHHPQHPAFSYPVIAVLVDLDEGPRILSNLVGVVPGEVRIGMPVQVAFRPTAGGSAVPVFEPRVAS